LIRGLLLFLATGKLEIYVPFQDEVCHPSRKTKSC